MDPSAISRKSGDLRYWLPASPNSEKILGLASSMASKRWQLLQSCEILRPSELACSSSWQRKQPGKSL